MKETLKQRTAKGLVWSGTLSAATQILNLVIGIFLGRLLTSADYGVVGVLTIFTAIASDLQSSGFTQALVNQPHAERRHYNAVFTFNVIVSGAMYAILFFCAPLIARFFRQDCLTAVSRFVFLAFLISSFSISHGGYLTKTMRNKEIAVTGILALVISGITGITLALLGYRYWALAWQQVTYITVITVGRYIFTDISIRPTSDLRPIRRMAPFALKILVTKIVNTLSSNILTLVFGRLYPISQVGHYTQAYKWNTMGHSVVSNAMAQIAQAVMVEARYDGADSAAASSGPGDACDDRRTAERQLRVFRKMLRFTAFLSMPLMLGLSLVAREFIILTIGPAWEPCVPLLQILCVSGAFLPLLTVYQNLAVSRGRSDIYMWLNLGQIALQTALVVLLRHHGMTFLVAAYTVFTVSWLLPWHIAARSLLHYRWRSAAADILPFALAAAAVMSATHLLTSYITSAVPLFLTKTAVAAVLYWLTMKVFRVSILDECETYIINHISRKRK